MPTESAIVIVVVLSAFVTFGAVVAWVDTYSRRRPDSQPAE